MIQMENTRFCSCVQQNEQEESLDRGYVQETKKAIKLQITNIWVENNQRHNKLLFITFSVNGHP